jgi:hypothetical protein|tara:strand:- start:334 stop:546 length:213 start_codon:yes stop_codon:yes gene_type:complete
MTMIVTDKTVVGDTTNFILWDGSGSYYVSRKNPVTDQEVIDELTAEQERNKQIIEDQEKQQAEIEANLNG